MMGRQMIVLFALLGLFGLPVTGHGDDIADIRASFTNEIRAFNAHNENAFISPAHTDVIVYGTLSPEAITGKAAFQQLIRDYFAQHEAAYFTPINPGFRVAGTSALAWGHYTLRDQTQEGASQTFHGRYSFTYTKTDTGWKLVALYFSPLDISPPTVPESVQVVSADDLADIRASFTNEIRAFNAHNENAFISPAHTDVIVYGTLSPEAIRGKAAFQQLIRDYFAQHEAAYFTPINPAFRVAGTSAAAWGHYRLVNKPKAEPRETTHGRYTFTYTKTDTGWKLVALYFSPLDISPPTVPESVQVVSADDLPDIRASFTNEIRAFNAHNENAFISPAHTDVIVYGTLSPEAITGKAAFQQLIRDYFAQHEAAYFTPINPGFRVAGTSALAWGHYTLRDQTQEGASQTFHGRYTFAYTKTDTGWKLVALYFSPLQESLS